ncbi:hypothetical protein DFH27DRAFT_289706 [Peziza echinospora]|nr:hypothetical protein DFH27DRAFT_289706 [Peziza echinospora]
MTTVAMNRMSIFVAFLLSTLNVYVSSSVHRYSLIAGPRGVQRIRQAELAPYRVLEYLPAESSLTVRKITRRRIYRQTSHRTGPRVHARRRRICGYRSQ